MKTRPFLGRLLAATLALAGGSIGFHGSPRPERKGESRATQRRMSRKRRNRMETKYRNRKNPHGKYRLCPDEPRPTAGFACIQKAKGE